MSHEETIKNCVAIITARGGSKRIPRKNIKNFLGKPIIQYSIDAALRAGCFDEVMVSTEDQEIAEVALETGAEIPFLRSKQTASDTATTAEVIEEVILQYKAQGQRVQYFCCIYPTAPFLSPEVIKQGYDLLIDSNADSVIPVVRFGYPIQRAFKIENDKLKMFQREYLLRMSQDLEPAFHDTGQFYWMRTKSFLAGKQLFTENTVPLELPESRVQDIDNIEDWKVAEIKYRILQELNGNGLK